ncbi:MAG: YicC/YloC family endoribonuclease [Rikenellaceae bacterium]
MIRSMTGFGKGEATINNKSISVEIRTLNSKQLDASLRMPSLYRSLEAEIRTLLNKGVQRGKCDLSINVSSPSEQRSTMINRELFAEYFRQISDACLAVGVDGDKSATIISAALRMPDVVSTQAEVLSEEEKAALLKATADAITHLNEFREQEGAILIADLLARVENIERLKEEVVPFEQRRVDVIKNRIREHIAKHKIEVDNNRFEAEMIFYVEKLDITEEKVRLNNHCNYFRQVAAAEDGVGRKLGFIAQEMGREINTMGSKANDVDIQRLVVQMKDELEKIKEQVLNIL